MQHPELGWIRAVTQVIGSFQLAHPSDISATMLMQ